MWDTVTLLPNFAGLDPCIMTKSELYGLSSFLVSKFLDIKLDIYEA